MKVTVFGASGKTGKLVVERAVAAGHAVTAFVHSAEDFHAKDVRLVVGDARDPVAVRGAIAGQDAVIDTVGGSTPFKETSLEQEAAQAIVDAMRAEDVRRLIVISALGVGDSKEQTPFWYKHLMLPSFLRGSTKDKAAMEEEVAQSGLEFVIARPPVLSDDAPTGSFHLAEGATTAHKITRGDLAQFLVNQLTDDLNLGKAVVVVNS